MCLQCRPSVWLTCQRDVIVTAAEPVAPWDSATLRTLRAMRTLLVLGRAHTLPATIRRRPRSTVRSLTGGAPLYSHPRPHSPRSGSGRSGVTARLASARTAKWPGPPTPDVPGWWSLGEPPPVRCRCRDRRWPPCSSTSPMSSMFPMHPMSPSFPAFPPCPVSGLLLRGQSYCAEHDSLPLAGELPGTKLAHLAPNWWP